MDLKLNKILSNYVDLNIDRKIIVSTTQSYNIETQKNISYDLIINLENVNNIRRINKFHEKVNEKMKIDGTYIFCAETIEQRKIRNSNKVLFGFKNLLSIIDFFFKRVIPKLPFFKRIYFLITKGYNRTLSKAEILGRAVSCGFKIVHYFEFNLKLYVITEKKQKPDFNLNPSYGPIFKMKRLGKNGTTISVYKFRTMHPYSEYLQKYVRDNHGYGKNSHKLKDDFRLTGWGKFFRKYWLDELPQLINVFKGEMKIIGIRPLSQVFFNELPEDLRSQRIKHKPACIPCYVSLCKRGIDGFVESERQYLKEKNEKPLFTDIKFTFMAMYNILTGKIRSS